MLLGGLVVIVLIVMRLLLPNFLLTPLCVHKVHLDLISLWLYLRIVVATILVILIIIPPLVVTRPGYVLWTPSILPPKVFSRIGILRAMIMVLRPVITHEITTSLPVVVEVACRLTVFL